MSSTVWTTANKVGLGMQLLYGLANIPSVGMSHNSGSMPAPPMGILWADTILGVLLVIAAVAAWRTRSRSIAALASVANVIITLTAIPAFLVDGVPNSVRALVAVCIAWTIVSVALTHRRGQPAAA